MTTLNDLHVLYEGTYINFLKRSLDFRPANADMGLVRKPEYFSTGFMLPFCI